MQKNILFIMCDQLRFDYLSCYGHPSLQTPNIDSLAKRGVLFNRAYVQSPVCGPSRMSYYTGRYMRSHGANWNSFPLRVGEPTLGEHLRKLGVRTVLVGKTHMKADLEGMKRLGIDPASNLGVEISECGFEPYERDDGLHPTTAPRPAYEQYLRDHGFDSSNPWEHWANSGETEAGVQNGWLLSHADKSARIPEEHSETPYMTQRAISFLADAKKDGRPWCLHLSYIKPHWPYIAPAPYHDMYGPLDVIPANRAQMETKNPHPVYKAFTQLRVARNFSRDGVREHVIPAYMGLIKQIDDQLGILFASLKDHGYDKNTMIVFTSDHGDYLGDHWLGEKDLFHDCSVRVPMIIYDPSPEADKTRGTVCDDLVEAIDLAPTFIDALGGAPQPHILEGHSLMPVLNGSGKIARKYVVSEYDYSMLEIRSILNKKPDEARMFMLFDGRFKYIHASGYRPMMFDLQNDPSELHDIGEADEFKAERERLREYLFEWALRDHNRITMSNERIEAYTRDHMQLRAGYIIGYWDEQELAQARLEALHKN